MNPSRILLLAAVLAALSARTQADATRSGDAHAKAQLAQMQVADGLAAGLFALEPMVVNPADMDVDHRGRVWVTEGANYRSSFQKWGTLRDGGDRIQILEDTDGDGVADQARTFYKDPSINTALGICVLGNRVIVSSAPYVFVLTDTDGDDVADRRELLFTTDVDTADHDHAVHAFVFGPDGKLYFNFGNAGQVLRRPLTKDLPLHGKLTKEQIEGGTTVKDPEGHEITIKGKPYRQGMAFRCNLDGSNVEVIGHNFRNNYELAVDSFGTVWQSDNDDDGNQGVRINYVMEGGNFGYTDEMTGAGWGEKRTGWEKEIPFRHWHLNDPGVVPNFLQTGAGAPTGIAIYEGSLLPAVFRDQVMHCDAGTRVVRSYPATKNGAGYSGTIANLLTSNDDWFRPSDLAIAPDGAVFVADWNDSGVGGHYMADQELATMTGRVYRVAPKGNLPSVPKLNLTTTAGAIQALQSPNQATRYLAWTAVHELGPKAEGALRKQWQGGMFAKENADPRQRARALYLLAQLPGKAPKYVAAALKDPDPDLRITGLRIAREQQLDLIPLVQQLVNDPSAQVRREAVLALRHSHSPEAPALWAALAKQHDGKDRWFLEALGIGADQQWDAYLGAWLASVGDQWNTPAGHDIIWRSRAKKTPELLVKLISDKAATEPEKQRYLRAFDFLTGPEKDAALLQILTAVN
ncbi:MAG TPA: PVC-type heme-binding CxxCH protein [Candidatus Limnocylindria bacterium]|nr:PVC-type heme-binding CxxCH protein [Candidatus Limnocylindria bacterium]